MLPLERHWHLSFATTSPICSCDELGSDYYNLALGEGRAKAAQKYLQTTGIAEERLSTISHGKEKPADAGRDEAARAKNRRDAFVVASN